MKRIYLLFLWIGFHCLAQAQLYNTSADIYLGLKKLNVLGSVLYIAAHPDDENTRLLTYFSKDRLYRTGYLSLTRGDGGQNLIGDEQGIELGQIRTQELLSARRIDGAEQFFTRAFDFGYSKTPAETFTKWDREKILADVVWVIRKFQPDVIITRFPTTGEGGHGHHTASAILANEAFTAAADPKRFPEQLKYVQAWQAKRILWNTFNFGGNNTTSPDQLQLDAGGYNALIGKSYGEIAADSRSQHKSQGFGVAKSRGEAIEFFKTTGGDAPTKDLFDGITTGWNREPGSANIQKVLDTIIAQYDFMHPERSVPGLMRLLPLLASKKTGAMMQKYNEVKNLIIAASGLFLEAYTTVPSAVQGDSVRINIVLNNRLGVPMRLTDISGGAYRPNEIGIHSDSLLPSNKNFVYTATLPISSATPITQPYWLKEKMGEGYYNVNDQLDIGKPDVAASILVQVKLQVAGQTVSFENIPVRYKFSDQVKGELYEPFVILPKVEVAYQGKNFFAVNGERAPVSFQLAANLKDSAGYTVRQKTSSLWKADSAFFHYRFAGRPIQNWNTALAPASAQQNAKDSVYLLATNAAGTIYDSYRRSIQYDHIPWITYFPKAQANLVALDIKTYGKKIGYIVGAGDKVPEALEQMGYEVTLITEKDLARLNLAQFDAIFSGVRAFNTNEWMNKYYDKLMQYVENGGNYIVQYSQNNNIRGKMGPYNFSLSGKRITDENAAVTFLKPDHAVLNFPNKITQADFTNWVQERSIYHADNLDPHFETILRMNDPNEKPDDGSLVIAQYGKGFFTYTGLVFFRELPAGVPGAYRLLANIIALNRKKEF